MKNRKKILDKLKRYKENELRKKAEEEKKKLQVDSGVTDLNIAAQPKAAFETSGQNFSLMVGEKFAFNDPDERRQKPGLDSVKDQLNDLNTVKNKNNLEKAIKRLNYLMNEKPKKDAFDTIKKNAGISEGCKVLDKLFKNKADDLKKGYDILLRIWSIVEKKCPEWQLDVYAMGDPTPYVKMMDELSIDKKRCHLNSSVVDVEEEYLNSSILVQPSRTEGFGLVLVEAMACGLPVISFDCENGPRSLITNNENGFLIPLFDVEHFADRILQLINDIDLRMAMGKRGFEKSKSYQIDHIGKQWYNIFEELSE